MNNKIKHILEDLELEYPQSIRMVINYIKTLESYKNKLDKELTIKTQQYEYLRHTYPYDEIERLNNIIDKTINILELSAQNKGICTCYETDTIQSALKELKEGK